MKFITIQDCACTVGRITRHPRSMWIVREPRSGLAVSNPSDTRKEAIADARKKIAAAGGSSAFNSAIEAAIT